MYGYRGFQRRCQDEIYPKITCKIDRLGEWEPKGGLRYKRDVIYIYKERPSDSFSKNSSPYIYFLGIFSVIFSKKRRAMTVILLDNITI